MNQVTYSERMVIYGKVIEKCGVEHQMNKFDEELGEFLAEYGRMRNGHGNPEKFADELGDLTIMMEQLRLIFGVNIQVCEHMDFKVRRLEDRMRNAEELL